MPGFPSKEQKAVIDHADRPLVVIAAPGTGKTSTIVTRMIRLLKEDPNREVSFITFTRTSQRDTENRLKTAIGKEIFENPNLIFPRISTLHKYAKSLVHKFADSAERDPRFSVLIHEKGEHRILLSELIEDISIEVDLDQLQKALYYYHCTGAFPDKCPFPQEKRGEVLNHWDLLSRFYNTFDMQALVKTACDILSKNKNLAMPPIFLQVDEYQDLNTIDQKLISHIGSVKGSEIVVVGDDAQSIYQFRHAHPEGIRDLWNSTEWDRIPFPDCHRLPTHILRAAQALISKEGYLGGKVNIPKDTGKKIPTLQCTTSDLQIDAIALLIQHLMKKKNARDGRNLSYHDFMVLCPTSAFAKKVAQIIEKQFQIPTKQKEKGNIPEDHWRLLLVLRMLHYSDSLALRQWLEIMGMEQSEISEIRTEAMESDKSLFYHCSELNLPAIKTIFTNLERLRKTVDDLEEFRQALKEFPRLSIEDSLFPEVHITINELTKRPYAVNSVIRFIYEKFGLFEPEGDIPEEDKVLVTTIYSAKGLEAEFVFIMWLNDTFLPAPGRDPREELRVLYVAMTRAKQDTILTFHEKYDLTKRVLLKEEAMSPFLKQIREHLSLQRIKKENLKNFLLEL